MNERTAPERLREALGDPERRGQENAALRKRVQELEGLVAELADEVEASVRQEWCVGGEMHPANVRRFERDMELPRRARRALEEE